MFMWSFGPPIGVVPKSRARSSKHELLGVRCLHLAASCRDRRLEDVRDEGLMEAKSRLWLPAGEDVCAFPV